MTQADPAAGPVGFAPARVTRGLGGRPRSTPRDLPLPLAILATAIPVLAASSLATAPWLHRTLALMGAVLLAAAALLAGTGLIRRARDRLALRTLSGLLEHDSCACYLADDRGVILARNFAARPGATIAAALAPLVADAEGLTQRLQREARETGRSSEDIAARLGTWRLSLQRVTLGIGLWRLAGNARSQASGPARPQGDWEAVEDLPVPLLKIAPSGVILAANRPARVLLPMPVESDSRLSDLLEGLGRPVAEWIADVAEGRAVSGPQVLRGTGAHQDTVLRVSLSLAGPGAEPHLIAVLNDVTEFKALEAQFVQSQKVQALGQLAGGVAHDFNNLLTAITGHCDLLLLRHDEDDPDYPDLIQINHNANRAASLVGQLLAFSRKQSMMPETFDLRLALSDLAHLLGRLVGEKVRLALHHDPAALHIRADRRQLEQVIMNLVVNARDAMPEGGEIRVETASRRLDGPLTLDRATIPPGRYVLVTVADQGTGIPPDRLPKIFEPFYTTKRPGEGTGLGLSTAYGIVKQSGGFIFAESELGRRTTFTLWFPAHDRPRAQPAPAAKRSPISSKAEGTILLVEDEAPVRAFAARALRLRGYSVLEADCAEGALGHLADPATRVDLILSDVILPDMDGPSWVREALIHRPGVRVIFVSGYAEEAFPEHKALIPGSVFLPKPFSLAELTAVVERQLAGEETPAPETSSLQPVAG